MSATYTYDPAGGQLSVTGTAAAANPLRYTQGLLDEDTGWLKLGVRYHDTTTANWTAQDPLSQLLQPDSASRYAYVGGDPLNRLDPTGKDFDLLDDCEAAVVGLALSVGGLVASIRGGSALGGGLSLGGAYLSVDAAEDNC